MDTCKMFGGERVVRNTGTIKEAKFTSESTGQVNNIRLAGHTADLEDGIEEDVHLVSACGYK